MAKLRELDEPERLAEISRGQEQCGKRGRATKTVDTGHDEIYFAELPRSGLLDAREAAVIDGRDTRTPRHPWRSAALRVL